VADRDAELHAVDLEHATRVAGHVESVLARVELVFRLNSLKRPLGIYYERGDLSPAVGDVLHPQNGCDVMLAAPLRDRAQRSVLVGLVEGRNFEVQSAQARQIRFGKAHDFRAAGRGVA